MPVEKIAMSGEKVFLFGPLKPKGLTNPRTNQMDYVVVQLRQDDKEGKLYNMVGFQTNLKWGEQKRVFSHDSRFETGGLPVTELCIEILS